MIIDYLHRIKPPYNVNSISQKEAIRILQNGPDLTAIKAITAERQRMIPILENIRGVIKVYPSDANFLLVKLEDHASLFAFLRAKGVIVRDRSRLIGCSQCLRLTVGRADENELLLRLIKEFYS